jgi:hypothetical protein
MKSNWITLIEFLIIIALINSSFIQIEMRKLKMKWYENDTMVYWMKTGWFKVPLKEHETWLLINILIHCWISDKNLKKDLKTC